jgi:hypothetical protein
MVATSGDIVSIRPDIWREGSGGASSEETYATCWYEIEVGVACRDIACGCLRAIESCGCGAGTGPEIKKVGRKGGSLGIGGEREVQEQEQRVKKGSQGCHSGIAAGNAGHSHAVASITKDKRTEHEILGLYGAQVPNNLSLWTIVPFRVGYQPYALHGACMGLAGQCFCIMLDVWASLTTPGSTPYAGRGMARLGEEQEGSAWSDSGSSEVSVNMI